MPRSSARRWTSASSSAPAAVAGSSAHTTMTSPSAPASTGPATVADIMALVSNGSLDPDATLADAIALLPQASRPAPYNKHERSKEEREERERERLKARHQPYNAAKEGIEYRLTGYKVWATTEGWNRELAKRKAAWAERKAGRNDFITADVEQPAAPRLPTLHGSSSAWKLPFAPNFRIAPVIGGHQAPSDDAPPTPHFANLTVTTSDGKQTILQRFSPTSERKAKEMQRKAEEGARLQKLLFDAAAANAKTLVLGCEYNAARRFGWTEDHLSCPDEADAMLRWTWRFFHDHILPIHNLLTRDFRLELDQRLAGFQWAQDMVGADQFHLAHHWWSTCKVQRGFPAGEGHDPRESEPTVLTCFGQACVLFLATDQGFFKTMIHPGQFVVFRAGFPYSVHPLRGGSGESDDQHWTVSLSMCRLMDKMVYGQKMDIQARQDPPQLEEEDLHRLRHPATARRAKKASDARESERTGEE